MKNKTICVKCRHHSGAKPTAPWYEHLCSAPDALVAQDLDPVTGRMEPEDQRRHCREVNLRGSCPHYAKRIVPSLRKS